MKLRVLRHAGVFFFIFGYTIFLLWEELLVYGSVIILCIFTLQNSYGLNHKYILEGSILDISMCNLQLRVYKMGVDSISLV